MAQWSGGSRTLFAKLVYYGPALGGKTTNLRALHRLVDPQATTKLLTIQTSDDRTLFFDLLPVEMGQILGHRVALKLYTVPGQVRYDATRRIVLAGADAVVFVADSSRAREAENRGSLENLRINMRANGLDPAAVPILFQFNKQDVRDAAPPEEVARWLGTDPARGFAAVAKDAEGVLETFIAAARAMVERLASLAVQRTHEPLEPAKVGREVDRAFAPCLARLRAKARSAPAAPAGESGSSTPIVLGGDDLLEQSLKASLVLGDRAATETARAERLDREADALRRLVRLESGEARIEIGETTPEQVVARAIDLSGVEGVGVEAAGEFGPVSLDAAHVARALANLVDNAAKFSPPDSPVTIRISPVRLRCGADLVDGVAFSVLDRGPGIPPGERERVLAPFEQGGDGLTGKPKGVDLGLHEAMLIARMHGGTLRWKDRDQGGSEIRLLVPLRAGGDAGPGEEGIA
jgi:hypothetical protein